MLKVTLDTNATEEPVLARLEAACAAAGVEAEFAHTTVSDRETEGTSFATAGALLGESPVYDDGARYDSGVRYVIPETLTLGESRLGHSAIGDSTTRFEAILWIVTDGSFPKAGARETLSRGQRRQLRDAIVLETHARERRDVFVTNDEVGFIRHGRREKLEALCQTRIRTVSEFCAEYGS